ncbi:aminotransferase class III-fold pyridoxal phosphate-dependent enzyme [Pseudomonas benzenivorans]|uniref:Aminotransferase class III-fold pyridoxal phosphate-dependent enzyme n=1 Tax=Pseudomonas benzenivorans TaxID=556533 RepID=A0ABZ0PTE6_9PSED|nr:aminotransferase class III-fold pyridoxal phosphate-dependent enzyme [Pseudomonas benzenivorans]WPC04161.1 aminotransferase class III-fold pyridoxal phosphate-dependent enzyme [Pseudomonas benzenivorans]
MNSTAHEFDAAEALASDRAHVWHHLSQHKPLEQNDPLMIVKGQGMRVWDAKGNEYLDAVSGAVWTVNVGYGRESIADAVREQLVTMNYFANTAGNIPGALFAKKLIEKMPGMSRVYYSNSGSEANEKAYKIVRQIAHKKYGGKKHKILFRERDYHGTTITALSSTGQFERKNQYGPFTPGFVEFPHCCEYRSQFGEVADYGVRAALEMERVILAEGPDSIGAVVLEPITAGGGVITPPAGYWETIQALCKKYDILLHIDEVVCGLGRTGKWFGYQHYGIQPDIVTMAKGVASGYAAISCTVTTEAVFEAFKGEADDRMGYFRDISTFGGCTAGPAAALENMRIIEEEGLLENVTQMGEYFLARLRELQDKYQVIGDVRGKGLFCGLELVKDRTTKEPVAESLPMAIAADCMRQGVIIGRTNRSFEQYNNTLCFSPALIATQADLDRIIAALDGAFGRLAANP